MSTEKTKGKQPKLTSIHLPRPVRLAIKSRAALLDRSLSEHMLALVMADLQEAGKREAEVPEAVRSTGKEA